MLRIQSPQTHQLRHRPLSACGTARDALNDLVEPFGTPEGFALDCADVQPAAMSSVARRLLAHREHMTLVLETHHKAPMEVHALQWIHEGDFYSRRLVLTPRGSETIVMAGFMRLNFSFMSQQVKQEILARSTPLGAILIRHDVLRRIEPLWFIEFPSASAVMKLFDIDTAQPTFGRLATIYCNGEPAIELMEAVLNEGE